MMNPKLLKNLRSLKEVRINDFEFKLSDGTLKTINGKLKSLYDSYLNEPVKVTRTKLEQNNDQIEQLKIEVEKATVMRENFQMLRNLKSSMDVTFELGDGHFIHAHRCILKGKFFTCSEQIKIIFILFFLV
jgi:hypothetical protein